MLGMYGSGPFNKANKSHVVGFVAGIGVAAVGYYAYTKNKDKVDNFLSSYGIKVAKKNKENYSEMTLEDLVLKKEHLEDLIAEKESNIGEVISE